MWHKAKKLALTKQEAASPSKKRRIAAAKTQQQRRSSSDAAAEVRPERSSDMARAQQRGAATRPETRRTAPSCASDGIELQAAIFHGDDIKER